MKTFNTDAILFAVATLGLAFCAAHAPAAEAVTPVATQTVRYADLNLDTAAGAKMLYRRIRAAAAHVRDDVTARQLEWATAAQTCVNRAVVSGVHAVNNSPLNQVANADGDPVQKRVTLASVR